MIQQARNFESSSWKSGGWAPRLGYVTVLGFHRVYVYVWYHLFGGDLS